MRRVSLALALLAGAGCTPAAPNAQNADAIQSQPATAPAARPAPAPPPLPEPITEAISGTALTLELVAVPAPGGSTHLWISRTEITWDLYDVFVYGLDGEADDTADVDAVTRPSKPYIAMDRGFGHAGFPALSMSAKGADAFCRWLSVKTGRDFRLPTEAEWTHLCRLGGVSGARVDEHAWYDANAERRTHPVGSKAPDALGLVDLIGNAAEWCVTTDGTSVARGGSYLTTADEIGCSARDVPTLAWNESDPQFPQSVWWYADAGFVGFRVVSD
ncbi:MAG: formylglycine-generating enzyme family protein [Planctomycetes bacterium]|nr:formylglycine-generating enzyme family protein [Planctomycetota bacterium]